LFIAKLKFSSVEPRPYVLSCKLSFFATLKLSALVCCKAKNKSFLNLLFVKLNRLNSCLVP